MRSVTWEGRRGLIRGATLAALTALMVLPGALPARAQARCADYVPQPKPQNADRDIVGQDLDEIQARGFIEFAVYEDFAPWSWEDHGTPRGVDVGIGKLVAEVLGVEPRFKFVQADESLEGDLRNWVWKGPMVSGQVANVMLHVPIDSNFACRIEQVVFTGQAYKEEIGIAYSTSYFVDSVPVPAYFRFDTVGVENDSISDFYLTSLIGTQVAGNIHRYPSTAAALAAVGAGEVSAAMGPRGQLEFERPEGVKVHVPPMPGFGVNHWTVGVGVSFHFRALAYAVDDAILAAIEDGRIPALFAEYGLTWEAPER